MPRGLAPSCDPNTPAPNAARDRHPPPRLPYRPACTRRPADRHCPCARARARAGGNIPVRRGYGARAAQFAARPTPLGTAEAALAANGASRRPRHASAKRAAPPHPEQGLAGRIIRATNAKRQLTYPPRFRKRPPIKAVPVAAVFYLMT